MNRVEFDAVNDELYRIDLIVKASEDWSGQYGKDDKTHAQLIRAEAKLEKILRGFYRDVADKAEGFIAWYAYRGNLQADYSIDVIVNDDAIDETSDDFITVVFDTMAIATAAGALAGETIYHIPLGIQSTDAIMQELTMKQVAGLVGKQVDKDGKITDNPKPRYNVTDTVRNDIRKSIQTSIGLGEDQSAAVARLRKVIANPKRAALIAQTETVNAYSNGLLEFGNQSGAVGKEWQDVAAIDICAKYADLGVVAFGYAFDGVSLQGPTAHGRCRCGLRLVYPDEWAELNK